VRYTEIFKEAKRLHALGFGLIWLHPKSKRPVESGWTKGDRQTWPELESTYRPGYNLGVRTGEASKLAHGYLACIDVDVKDPAAKGEALAALKKLVGDRKLPEVRSGSGNGSRHLYCVTLEPFKMITVVKEKDRFEICVYSTGRQMVLPPSVHPAGPLYAWKSFIKKAGDVPLMKFEAPEAQAKPASKADAGDKLMAEDAQAVVFNFTVKPVDLSWLPISDEVRDAIVDGKGVEDRSGYLLRAATALLSAGLDQDEVLSVLTDRDTYLGQCGYDHAKTSSRAKAAAWVYRYTFKKVAAERSAESVFSAVPPPKASRKLTQEEMEEQAQAFAEERSWRQELDRTKEGAIRSTLRNLDLILTNAVDPNLFVEDLFASRIEYGTGSPWGRPAKTYIEDIDQTLLKHWVSEQYGIEPSTNLILEATSLIAHRKSYHPVRDYLNSLVWDGVPRLDTWVRDFCRGDAPTPYLPEVSRKFFVALVKRVFEPGCQWDYVLVLEGHQGKKKSSAARAIAGDKWFMDNLPDLRDKDSMLSLQGKWLVELGELAGVKRADFNQVKAYLSRRQDTVRAHYGRLARDVPRQSVFIGTVNEGQYFKDPTGNRRFWPVKTGLCDVDGLIKVRDQLFAEAVYLYREKNEPLYLSPEAEQQAKDLQDDRRIDDDETEMREALEEYLGSKECVLDLDCFRIRDLTSGPAAPWGRWSHEKYFMQTAAQVLRNLGFERRKVRGQRVWGKSESGVISPFNKGGQTPGADPSERGTPSAPEIDDLDFY